MKDEWQWIDPIPQIKADPEFNKAFQFIQQPYVWSLPNEEHKRVMLELVAGQWLIWLHWVVKKKWLKKHKIPVSRKYALLYEPRGEHIYRILNLCLQCHSSKWGRHYRNAADWFCCLIEAERNAQIAQALTEVQSRGHQRLIQNEHQKIINCLASWANPYDPESLPHHYRLMQAALQMAEQKDIFYKEHWRPYLTAYRKWKRALDGDTWEAVWLEEKQIKSQIGKGSRKRNLPLPTHVEAILPTQNKDVLKLIFEVLAQ